VRKPHRCPPRPGEKRKAGLGIGSALEWKTLTFMLLAAAGVAGVLSLHQLVRVRRARFYILAKRATTKAKRRLTTTGLLLLAAALVAVFKPEIPLPQLPTPSPTSEPTAASTPTAQEPSVTRTLVSTATPTASPSPTPEVLPPSIALTPLPGAVPAGQEAAIVLTAVAMDKTDGGRPVEPAAVFPGGDHAIYVFFTYSGLQDGVARTFAWYREGEFWPRCSDTALWEWGPRGATWFFCRPSDGWEPGQYEVRAFVERAYQGTVSFSIVPESE
jgi:hypothetical protein